MKRKTSWFWDYLIGFHLLQFVYWLRFVSENIEFLEDYFRSVGSQPNKLSNLVQNVSLPFHCFDYFHIPLMLSNVRIVTQ